MRPCMAGCPLRRPMAAGNPIGGGSQSEKWFAIVGRQPRSRSSAAWRQQWDRRMRHGLAVVAAVEIKKDEAATVSATGLEGRKKHKRGLPI
ncbi:hypothetical protein Nepgr_031003 [Nepenthes gracilis]|uniref:Uncharacterized protein n=1 Tax=Nepenthes gracilis TaxID=150966 RepID=A0AAD3Y6D3_NEPGR|nr:hypothetical protein Nepgr_031003 [Nepenthes gracilis]